MKKVNAMEMRNVEGGYAVKCTSCGKTARGIGPMGVTTFMIIHAHGSTIWYRYGNRSGDKWWH